MDDLLSRAQTLVPLWTEKSGDQASDCVAARPVLIEVATLHATMQGQMLELCSSGARVLPAGPLFLWKNTAVSVRFGFNDVVHTVSGLTGGTEPDDSFRFEFDAASRECIQALYEQLRDAGLLQGDEMQECECLKEEDSEARDPEPAEKETGRDGSGGSERRVHARYNLAAPATLTIVSRCVVFDCEVIELSLGGCRVRTARPLNYPVRTRVEIQFVGLGLPLRLPARLQVKVGDSIAGLKYLEVSPRVRERLADLIEELNFKAAPRG